MLKFTTFIAILLNVSMVANTAFAESNKSEPVLEGFGWYTCAKEAQNEKCRFNSLVSKLNFETESPLDVYLEVQLIDISSEGVNGIREMWFSYTTDDLTIKVGQLFLAAGFVTKAPDDLETVSYQRTPESVYGKVVQLSGSLNENWSFVADVGALPGTSVDDSHQYDGVSFSGRLSRSFESGTFTVSTQQSGDFHRYSIDGTHQVGSDISLKSVIYYTDEEDYSQHGGFASVGWRALDWLELHSQVDYNSHQESTIYTNGVRVWPFGQRFSVIADYESSDSGDGQFLARMQVKF